MEETIKGCIPPFWEGIPAWTCVATAAACTIALRPKHCEAARARGRGLSRIRMMLFFACITGTREGVTFGVHGVPQGLRTPAR